MSHHTSQPVHVIGVSFDDTILRTSAFGGTIATGNAIIRSIGGIGNLMAQPAFSPFHYHVFCAPPIRKAESMQAWITEEYANLDLAFHVMPGVQPRAIIIESEGATSRQSIIFGHFEGVKEFTFNDGSIVHLCYLENTPCIIHKDPSVLLVGDFNNAVVYPESTMHNISQLDVLLLSIDEIAAFKSKLGFHLLRDGCQIIAHEPLRIIMFVIENGKPIEMARLENQHYIPQASNLTGNGDVFAGHILDYLAPRYQPGTPIGEATFNQSVRHAQQKTAAWLLSRTEEATAQKESEEQKEVAAQEVAAAQTA